MLATLSATRTDDAARRRRAGAPALTGGYHLAFAIGAGLVVAAIGVALAVLARAGAGGRGRRCGPQLGEAEVAYSEAA